MDRFVFGHGTVRVHNSNGQRVAVLQPGDLPDDHQPARRLPDYRRDRQVRGDYRARRYQLSILAVGPRSGGKCTRNKPPVAFHKVINASGPVSVK
jgi:hypothetical protein